MNVILKNKKIAIVHDSFVEFGGAERVLFYLIKMFPKADVYTSLIAKQFQKDIQDKSQGILSFSKLSVSPFILNHASFFKPYFFHHYWESLNLDHYDLVISSSHSFCANFVKVKNKHLSYIYTPPRFLYAEFNELSWLKKPFFRKLTGPYFEYLKNKSHKKVRNINLLIADSVNVQKRIEKYYQTKSVVIYPPVKLAKRTYSKDTLKAKNYLFFSRLVKQKGIELVIQAFNKNQKPLLVVGTSGQAKKWQKLANKNIKFLGFLADRKMPNIYKKSKALVYAAINEDFGMVPVEVMSHGIPIIAYRDGGVKESVIDKKTGLFFDSYDFNSLNQAVAKFEQMSFSKKACTNQAKKFSEEKFKKQILAQIYKHHLLRDG